MQWGWFCQSNPQTLGTFIPGVEGKPQFPIYIAAFLFWPFHSNPAPLLVFPGWMETQEGWERLTHLGHSGFVLWSLPVTAHSFASFSTACTWHTEAKKGSLDQQLRANNSCWLTLRGCGIHLPCITVPSILPEKPGNLKINSLCPWQPDNPGAAQVALQWEALRFVTTGAATGPWNKSWALWRYRMGTGNLSATCQ